MHTKLSVENRLDLLSASRPTSKTRLVPCRTVGQSDRHDVWLDYLPECASEVAVHTAPVYRLAFSLTGDSYDAEDLMQGVFVRVLGSRSAYDSAPCEHPLLEHLLHGAAEGPLRDLSQRKQTFRHDALAADLGERVVALESAPTDALDDPRLDFDVKVALNDLPPDVRSAVLLHDIEGLSAEETAMTLGITIGTLRSRVERGRSQLRIALAHWAQQGTGVPVPETVRSTQ